MASPGSGRVYLVPVDADLAAPSAVERCIPSADFDGATKDDRSWPLPAVNAGRDRLVRPAKTRSIRGVGVGDTDDGVS